MIAIRLRNVSMLVQGDLPKEASDAIRQTLKYEIPGYKYMPLYKQQQQMASLGLLGNKKPWDGVKTLAKWTDSGLQIPTGLLSYVKEILSSRNIEYEIIDERVKESRTNGWSLDNLVLRDYQQDILDAMLRRQRGVLKIATGGGKTEMLVSAMVTAAAFPSIFYVTSCDLLEQAYERFRKYARCDGQVAEIGRVGAGHCDIQPITIATVQSCQRALGGAYTKYKYDDEGKDDKTVFDAKQKAAVKNLVHSAQFVYVDEAHHVSSDTIQEILNKSYAARIRIGGSASPWRDDGLDILIEACFGRRLCDVSASFLIENGYLVRPQITFNHFSQALGVAANWNAHYKTYVVENKPRNQWVAKRAIEHMEAGRPTIILVKWVPHAENLAKLIPGSVILTASGKDRKTPMQRKKYFEQMRQREIMCIIGTSLLDEGVDIPSASAGIFAGGGKSSTRALQRVGRFIRKDRLDEGKEAFIEEFFDRTKWLTNHSKMRRRILETEPGFILKDNRETLSL